MIQLCTQTTTMEHHLPHHQVETSSQDATSSHPHQQHQNSMIKLTLGLSLVIVTFMGNLIKAFFEASNALSAIIPFIQLPLLLIGGALTIQQAYEKFHQPVRNLCKDGVLVFVNFIGFFKKKIKKVLGKK